MYGELKVEEAKGVCKDHRMVILLWIIKAQLISGASFQNFVQ
jgi:hypothetical protein